MLIRDALQQAQQQGVARFDAQLLLVHLLTTPPFAAGAAFAADTITRSWLLAHDDQPLSATQRTAWAAALVRRAAGEPLAYIVGEQPFCGLLLKVTPAVLIPRPETEGLVDWAVARLQTANRANPRVMDLGTGSGAVALAIKHRCPGAEVWATDLSRDALAVATENAARLRLPVAFLRANWWTPAGAPAGANPAGLAPGDAPNSPPGRCGLPALETRFDLVVSNPPYIAVGDTHLAALQHEPQTALVGGGADGLADLRQIISSSPLRLAPGAWLLLEHGHDQHSAVQALLRQAGFVAPHTRADLAGLPRCTGARWPG